MSDVDDSWLKRNQPPWLAFPSLPPDELPRYLTQGETEWWFDEVWRPFWNSRTRQQKDEYLSFWNASLAWRAALDVFDVDPGFDAEADARESEEYFARKREASSQAPTSLWRKIFRRRK